MILASALVLLFSACVVLHRAVVGPSVYDRILAVNALGTKTVLLVLLIGFLDAPSFFIDTSMVYALVNFVATIAILRFVSHRRLG